VLHSLTVKERTKFYTQNYRIMVLDMSPLAFRKKYSVRIYIRVKQELLIYCKMYTLQQKVISEIKLHCIYIRPDMFQLVFRVKQKLLLTVALYSTYKLYIYQLNTLLDIIF
jgi:hypothetical protein